MVKTLGDPGGLIFVVMNSALEKVLHLGHMHAEGHCDSLCDASTPQVVRSSQYVEEKGDECDGVYVFVTPHLLGTNGEPGFLDGMGWWLLER